MNKEWTKICQTQLQGQERQPLHLGRMAVEEACLLQVYTHSLTASSHLGCLPEKWQPVNGYTPAASKLFSSFIFPRSPNIGSSKHKTTDNSTCHDRRYVCVNAGSTAEVQNVMMQGVCNCMQAALQRYEAACGGAPERLVSGSDDFTMFLWEPSVTKKPLQRLTGHMQLINQVHPCSSRLLS